MNSNIVNELKSNLKPIVFFKTDKKVKNAIEMREGSHGCIMLKIANVITKRKTFIVSSKTCSCNGAFPGLGFGSNFKNESDISNHAAFLAYGLKSAQNKKSFKNYVNEKPKDIRDFFNKGERIFTNYEESYKFVSNWSSRIIDGEYAVFKPLEDLEEDEIPISVIFTLNSLELSALLSLYSSINKEEYSQINFNQSSACQSIAWEVYNQDKNDLKPVLGLIDLAGRSAVKPLIGDEYINISFPWEIFLKLEDKSNDCIFQSPIWIDR